MSPTARTLQHFRKHGFRVGVVERYNQYSRQKNDLLGFIDLIAINDLGIYGVQCTSTANHAARIHKILNENLVREAAIGWLRSGGHIEVISWRKLAGQKKDGSKSARPRWVGKCSVISLNVEKTSASVEFTEDIE